MAPRVQRPWNWLGDFVERYAIGTSCYHDATVFMLLLCVAALILILAARIWKMELLRQLSGGLWALALSSLALWTIGILGDPEPYRRWTELAVVLTIGYILARGVILVVVEWLLVQRAGVKVPRLARDVFALLVYIVMAATVIKTMLDVDIGALLATSAVLTVVIGLALQETLGTLLAGLNLAWEQRIRAGEWIQLDDEVACVEELGWRSLMVRTRLGERVLIPNSDAARARVRMLGRGERPVAVPVRLDVAYGSPPHLVLDVLLQVAREMPDILKEPPPRALVAAFADSGITYEVRLWTHSPWRDYDISSTFLTRAHAALARASMEIPFPQRTVHMAKPEDPELACRKIRRALAGCPLFAGLAEQALDELAGSSALSLFAPNELVVRKGEISDSLFVIASGSVEIMHRRRSLNRLDKGEVFGERAMLTGEPRSADVRATTSLQAVEVDREALARVIESKPEIADQLADRMAARDPLSGEPSGAIELDSGRGVVAQIRDRLLKLVGG